MPLPQHVIDPGGRKRRRALLERIGGFWSSELLDTTVAGRKRVIATLQSHERAQRRIATETPQYYDAAFHKMILAALSHELEALASLERRFGKVRAAHQLELIK
jgi:hypothetical protein